MQRGERKTDEEEEAGITVRRLQELQRTESKKT